MPFPGTMVFEHPQAVKSMVKARGRPMEFPCVLKGNSGGGGANVFCIQDEQNLFERLDQLPEHESVLIQEWIDLAGFDILFPVGGGPLFLEVNFLFGRKGLGGLQGYRRMFRQAVQDWMDRARMDAASNERL